jgi:hypothetical protein
VTWQAFATGMLVRYLPGRIWGIVSSSAVLSGAGVPVEFAYWVQLAGLACLSVAAVVWTLVAWVRIETQGVLGVGAGYAGVCLIFGMCLLVLLSGLPTWAARRSAAVVGSSPAIDVPSRRLLGLASLLALGSVLAQGFAFLLCLGAFPGGHIDLVNATGIVSVAWLAGFYSFLAPGGIGVRESVLVALGSYAGAVGPVATAALLARCTTTVAELITSLPLFLTASPGKAGSESSSEPEC